MQRSLHNSFLFTKKAEEENFPFSCKQILLEKKRWLPLDYEERTPGALNLYISLEISIFIFWDLRTFHLPFDQHKLYFLLKSNLTTHKHKKFHAAHEVSWNTMKTHRFLKIIHFQIQLVHVPSFIVKTFQKFFQVQHKIFKNHTDKKSSTFLHTLTNVLWNL